MTNRERLWRKACHWVAGWQGGKSTPTPQMAYLAGWQAAMREQRKTEQNAFAAAAKRNGRK